MAWTILHPNCFMECAGNNLRGGQWSFYYGDAGVGWIAVKDIATVAAVALREGPKKHHGKSYWLSTEVLNGPQIGALLTEQLGTPIMVDVKTDEDFLKDLHAHKFKQVMDDYYGKCFSVFLREVRTAGNYRDCKRRCAVRYRKTLHDIPAVDQGEQRELPDKRRICQGGSYVNLVVLNPEVQSIQYQIGFWEEP
ncbi:hypothetical protein RvY_08131 [Ramazzottius varieornatus]|uniref:Uncharacterized protein n=1 Tax=Ramazzottius varieornatus TaxID=947166 RepID=A0A1D1V748_RAMVA|nr:hypothetical protein RvY_08131 [Ramazzottius varieornatus]